MDPNAFNYEPAATNEIPGSCIPIFYGCIDPLASNYHAGSNVDDGSCLYPGCTDSTMLNYNPSANIDDGTCIMAVPGCTDSTMFNYNPNANIDCGGDWPLIGDPIGLALNYCCNPVVMGCLDTTQTANNYNANANTDDGSCKWNGCTDPLADNYSFTGSNPTVDGPNGNFQYLNGIAVDNGTCTYPGGCTDPLACNYDSTPGIVDNGTCNYCGDTATNVLNYDAGACSTYCEYCDHADLPLAYNTQQSTIVNNIDQYNGSVVFDFNESSNAVRYRVFFTGGTNSGMTFDIDPVNTSASYTLVNGTVVELYSSGWGTGLINVEIVNLNGGSYTFILQTICHGTQSNAGAYFLGVTGDVLSVDLNAFGTSGYIPFPEITFVITQITPGCTDNTACNYDANATQDDGSCIDASNCTGCTIVASTNYDPNAIFDDGSCIPFQYGCTDSTAFNYSPNANLDDGSCVPFVYGCLDSTLNNDGTFASSNFAGIGGSNYNSVSPVNTPCNADATGPGNNECCNTYNSPTTLIELLGTGTTTYWGNNIESQYLRVSYDVANTPYNDAVNSVSSTQFGEPDFTNDSLDVGLEITLTGIGAGTVQSISLRNGGDLSNGLLPVSPINSYNGRTTSAGNFNANPGYVLGNLVSNPARVMGLVNLSGLHTAPIFNATYGSLDSVVVNVRFITNDGNVDFTNSRTYSVGCTDSTAVNYDPNVEITDINQCVYAGCMDTTPTVDGGIWATNYDPNITNSCQTSANSPSVGDNACCEYNVVYTSIFEDQPTSNASVMPSQVVIADNTSGTGYTKVRSNVTIGAGQSNALTADYTSHHGSEQWLSPSLGYGGGAFFQSVVFRESCATLGQPPGLPSSFLNFDPTNCVEWGSYVVNNTANPSEGTLNITLNTRRAMGDNTNGSVTTQNEAQGYQFSPAQSSPGLADTFTVGCKHPADPTLNYASVNASLNLHDESMCIEIIQGCSDSNATNYVANANVDCAGASGPGTDTSCCCYTCADPTNVTVNNLVANAVTSPTGASTLDLNWTPVPHSTSVTIYFYDNDNFNAIQAAGVTTALGGTPSPQATAARLQISDPTVLSSGTFTIAPPIFAGYIGQTPNGYFENHKEYRLVILATCENDLGTCTASTTTTNDSGITETSITIVV